MKLKHLRLAAKIITVVVTGSLITAIVVSTVSKEKPTQNNTTPEVIVEETTDSKVDSSEDDIFTYENEKESSSQTNITAPKDNNTNSETNPMTTDREEILDLSPSEQAVIHAGYGIVVLLPTGNYGVLTHGDGCVNGVDGFIILENYLSELGLKARTMTGGWISSANDWYWHIAKDPTPIGTSNNEW